MHVGGVHAHCVRGGGDIHVGGCMHVGTKEAVRGFPPFQGKGAKNGCFRRFLNGALSWMCDLFCGWSHNLRNLQRVRAHPASK